MAHLPHPVHSAQDSVLLEHPQHPSEKAVMALDHAQIRRQRSGGHARADAEVPSQLLEGVHDVGRAQPLDQGQPLLQLLQPVLGDQPGDLGPHMLGDAPGAQHAVGLPRLGCRGQCLCGPRDLVQPLADGLAGHPRQGFAPRPLELQAFHDRD